MCKCGQWYLQPSLCNSAHYPSHAAEHLRLTMILSQAKALSDENDSLKRQVKDLQKAAAELTEENGRLRSALQESAIREAKMQRSEIEPMVPLLAPGARQVRGCHSGRTYSCLHVH